MSATRAIFMGKADGRGGILTWVEGRKGLITKP